MACGLDNWVMLHWQCGLGELRMHTWQHGLDNWATFPWWCGFGDLGMQTWQHRLHHWARRLHNLAKLELVDW